MATDSSSPWMYVLETCQEEKFSPPLESELSLCLSWPRGTLANVPRADTWIKFAHQSLPSCYTWLYHVTSWVGSAGGWEIPSPVTTIANSQPTSWHVRPLWTRQPIADTPTTNTYVSLATISRVQPSPGLTGRFIIIWRHYILECKWITQ